MKNNKLKIEDLKVKSFVTSMKDDQVETVKGGLLSIGNNCTLDDGGCDDYNRTKGLFCNDHIVH
ncbi:MAG: pinensin family lanthipeptide [Bacteroidota bacterium]